MILLISENHLQNQFKVLLRFFLFRILRRWRRSWAPFAVWAIWMTNTVTIRPVSWQLTRWSFVESPDSTVGMIWEWFVECFHQKSVLEEFLFCCHELLQLVGHSNFSIKFEWQIFENPTSIGTHRVLCNWTQDWSEINLIRALVAIDGSYINQISVKVFTKRWDRLSQIKLIFKAETNFESCLVRTIKFTKRINSDIAILYKFSHSFSRPSCVLIMQFN